METKICTKCGIEKPLSAFCKHKKAKDGLCERCKICHCEDVKMAYHKKHPKVLRKDKNYLTDDPEYERKKHLRFYGLTLDDYNQMFENYVRYGLYLKYFQKNICLLK